MINYKKGLRKLMLYALSRSRPQKLLDCGERRVLRAFRRAVASVSAYRTILAAHDLNPEQIQSVKDFRSLCPTLNKDNTFGRFSLEELCVPGTLDELAGVLTSSGQGRTRLAFGLSTWRQARHAADEIDLGLQYAFQVDQKKTLLINCLPMGVRFSSNSVTIAETSVREDMAVALASEIGRFYEQIILVGDPLFLKLLTDYARDQGLDWGRYRTHLIIGEETFGENYRNYLAGQFQLNADDPSMGLIGSSMGIGELGLNLFYETPETIKLRRLAHANQDFFKALFGLEPETAPLPMLFVYNPLRLYVETLEADEPGYGQLTISMADTQAALPLMRYQTGDVARLLSQEDIERACNQVGISFREKLTLPIMALKGRDKDQLVDGTHVGQYKDALYVHQDIALRLTGAFRLEYRADSLIVHIQLRRGYLSDDDDLRPRLAVLLPGTVLPEQLHVWSYEQFPFSMTLDYERKFSYFV